MSCISLQEEFHAAADLLHRALATKEKPLENTNDVTLPEFMESKISEKLQGSDTCAKDSDTQTDVITKQRGLHSSTSDSFGSSRNLESKDQQHNACNNSQIQFKNLSLSEENNSTKSTHEAVSLDERPEGVKDELYTDVRMASELVIKEQDSDSEDELEQFVLQPRSSKHRSHTS